MIGKAYVSTFQFYNNHTHKMEFKNRPILIVGQADSTNSIQTVPYIKRIQRICGDFKRYKAI